MNNYKILESRISDSDDSSIKSISKRATNNKQYIRLEKTVESMLDISDIDEEFTFENLNYNYMIRRKSCICSCCYG
jgi:hypothetical protein